MVEKGTTGVFHATGPETPMPMGEMLSGMQSATGADVTFTWVDAEFLAQHEVAPWMHMTVWIPPNEGYEGFSKVDCSRALAQGLTFRPLAETVRDTLVWWNALPEERRSKPRAGLPAEREAEVLAAWHARDEAAEGSMSE
jgi:2'-hydroxyisoflavone reductase